MIIVLSTPFPQSSQFGVGGQHIVVIILFCSMQEIIDMVLNFYDSRSKQIVRDEE